MGNDFYLKEIGSFLVKIQVVPCLLSAQGCLWSNSLRVDPECSGQMVLFVLFLFFPSQRSVYPSIEFLKFFLEWRRGGVRLERGCMFHIAELGIVQCIISGYLHFYIRSSLEAFLFMVSDLSLLSSSCYPAGLRSCFT